MIDFHWLIFVFCFKCLQQNMGIVEGLETPPITVEEPSTGEPSTAEEPSPIEKESTSINEEPKSFAEEPFRSMTGNLTSNTEELISTEKEQKCDVHDEVTSVHEELKFIEELSVVKETQKHEDDVQTIEEARIVIKQLKDRCRFQTHQALLWRKKARIQVNKRKGNKTRLVG